MGNGHEAEWRKRQNCQRGDCGQLNEPAVIQQNPGTTAERDATEELAGHLESLLGDRQMRVDYAAKARARAEKFSWGNTWGDIRGAAGI